MEIGSSEYREAACEMLDAAVEAHRAARYVASHYLAGLSVECILRAHRWRINSSWDGRHVLIRLAKSARFFELVPPTAAANFQYQFGELTRRWSNDHRYASPNKLPKYLNSI